jgi:hypothetical protein
MSKAAQTPATNWTLTITLKRGGRGSEAIPVLDIQPFAHNVIMNGLHQLPDGARVSLKYDLDAARV